MPVTPTYPGVYLQEIDSGVRTIIGVATSITAFLGRAARGPVNQPYLINSYADYERVFGGLHKDSTMSYAVCDFYTNGGSQALIVRLYAPLVAFDEYTAAEAVGEVANQVVKAALAADPNAKLTDADVSALTGDGKAVDTEVKKFTSEPAQSAAKAVAAAVKSAAEKDKPAQGIIDTVSEKLKDYPITTAKLSVGGTDDSAAAKAIQDEVSNIVGADDAALDAAKVDDLDPTKLDKSIGKKLTEYKGKPGEQAAKDVADVAKAKAAIGTLAKVVKDAVADKVSEIKGAAVPLELTAKYEGAWGNNLLARIEHPSQEIAKQVIDRYRLPTGTKLFDLFVHDPSTGNTEVFRNLTTSPGRRSVVEVLENESNLVRIDGTPSPVIPAAHATVPANKIWEDESAPSKVSIEAQESRALNDSLDFVGNRDQKTGIYALETADLFNLMCIPPDTRDDDLPRDVASQALDYCVDRRAFLIVDPPKLWGNAGGDAANKVKAAMEKNGLKLAGLRGRNAMVYFPRVKMSNPLRDDQIELFPACGIIAGLFARTDVQRGVWKAPAGIDASLNGVQELEVKLNDLENGMLNPLGVNVLRNLRVYGNVMWGSRTLRGADAFADDYKYIPIRRLALYIEESLYRGTQWVVFEPNDEPLWGQVRLGVGAFMHDLFRQGAFQGRTPRDAYFVKCDKDNNPQSDINKGIVHIDVGFAALKPAEFVIITLQQMAGQIQV